MSTSCPQCFGSHPGGLCPAAGTTGPVDPGAFDAELEPGTVVGEYVVESKLGDGGFGTVYRATHPVIGKAAAVKVLKHQFSANPEMVHRFVAEARAVNTIRHKNIIDIFSFGKLPDGRRFYVMELLEGHSLDEVLLLHEQCEPRMAFPILRGIAQALDAAHAAGVVHRDLKPENVFLVHREDGSAQVKLLDFGIAKLQSAPQSSTRAGLAMGTPHYMSPEQWRGRGVDARSDVYAFGVVAYRTLTGLLPYDAPDPMDIMVLQSTQPVRPPSQVLPSLPPAMDAPILAMLERDPSRRPASAGLALAAVERAFGATERTPTPDYATLSRRPASLVHAGRPVVPLAIHSSPTMAEALAPATPPQATPPRRSRAHLALALTALAVTAALVLAILAKGHPRTTSAATAAVPSLAPPAASVPSPELPPPAAAPTASTVSVLVTCVPPGADVYLGDVRLGAAPGPLSLPRASEPATLGVRAPGFRPEDVQVPTDRDSAISIKLRPAPRGPARTPGLKDSLERF